MSFAMLLVIEVSVFIIAANGLQLPEGGVFEALHCQPSTNFEEAQSLI